MFMDPLKRVSKVWDAFERRTTRKFMPHEKKLWNALVFILRFLSLAIPFHIILWTNFDAYPLQVFVAKAVSYLLALSGANVVQADNFIYLKAPSLWTIEIIKDCVGWKSFLAFAGLVFAVRGIKIKKRLLGVACGALVIFSGNILRIYTSLYASTIFGIDKFTMIHDVLWQGGMMALILGAWIVWLRLSSGGRKM